MTDSTIQFSSKRWSYTPIHVAPSLTSYSGIMMAFKRHTHNPASGMR